MQEIPEYQVLVDVCERIDFAKPGSRADRNKRVFVVGRRDEALNMVHDLGSAVPGLIMPSTPEEDAQLTTEHAKGAIDLSDY